jgi:AraC-like DNA-binding protein
MLRIDVGITLFRGIHHLEPAPCGQMVPLTNSEGTFSETTFSAQVIQGGMLCHQEGSPQLNIISAPGRDVFRYQDSWHARASVEGGVNSEMTSVLIGKTVLAELMGTGLAEQLIQNLALSSTHQTVVHAIPSHVTTPLLAAMSSHFTGPSRRLYVQAKVMEYLAALSFFVCHETHGQIDRRRAERRHRTRIQELHEHLLKLEGNLPTTSELAANFGLSPRQLNSEFAAEYGKSIFVFTTELRLEQAHAALQESSTPMKVIAANLGYSHVNHFITAFKRKFGYPPGKVRSKL